MSLKNKKILLGVTGGISIYKVCDLVSRLIKKGAILEIIMTEAATKLVSPLVFETMGRCKVYTDMFHEGHHEEVEHIELPKRADAFLIAPASGNTMAKIAHGIADNLLTSAALAYDRDIIFAVAMNTNMLNNLSTQDNIKILKDRKHKFIESNVGILACNTIGDGRLAEPVEIVEYMEDYFTKKDLIGKKILVTAGPTRERIDPVRYLSNDSSGKMGYSIAKAAKARGASVTLITGPVKLDKPNGIDIEEIESTEDMFNAVGKYFDNTDALIMAAAPSDYRARNINSNKIKKEDTDKFEIDFIENKDIVKYFGNNKNKQIVIGFAAETTNLIDNAKSKLKRKNLDYIVANDVTKKGAGFNVDTNIVSVISKDEIVDYPIMDKTEIADKILDLLVD
ncbi:MAG: bifunctional phosphopantothenoylcysteine decarboxylase/phosphopantothenate--cysteine ligase CoaBC [Tissierellia bacterium]|nr:bifunctional phosphopantothenoylcysteine decarboxylase/phosphopantothenate--cysteine ligase CoaBC [Tissierellia bacterium]